MHDERRGGGAERADEERAVGVPPHQPPLPPGRSEDDRVDEIGEESFPGSDPPATGGPGI